MSILHDEAQQAIATETRRILGARTDHARQLALLDACGDWASSWIGAPTMRLAGGADEMLLNTIAEKILGLPQDHRPDKGVPFNEIPA